MKVKQQRKNGAAMGKCPSSSSRNTHNITFEFCRNQHNRPSEGWKLQAEHRIPGAPPSYLPTSQSEKRLHTTADNEDFEPLLN